MGILTRAELMAQAGLAAGNDQAASFVRTWLNTWLQRTAKSWSWPVLKRSTGNIPVDAGSIGVQIEPADVGGNYIHRLLNGTVFWRVQSGYSPSGRAFIRPLSDTNPDIREELIDTSKGRGKPETVKVRTGGDDPGGWGTLTLLFDKATDVALYISFDAHVVPPNLNTLEAGDTLIPWYPNDRTLIQACKVAILEIDAAGERDAHYDAENMKLGAMVVDDRDFDGEQAGDNQLMALDPSVFR